MNLISSSQNENPDVPQTPYLPIMVEDPPEYRIKEAREYSSEGRLGYEMEGGLFYKDSGRLVTHIDGITSNHWLHQMLLKHFPKLAPYILDEEGAGEVELALPAEKDMHTALHNIFEAQYFINSLLEPKGIIYKFIALPPLETPFVPANNCPNSRGAQVVEAFGPERAPLTLIFGCQPNINLEPYLKDWLQDLPDTEFARLLFTLQIYNAAGENIDDLITLNNPVVRNEKGLSRMDILKILLIPAKKERFKKAGIKPLENNILYPSGMSLEDLIRWEMAHNNTQRLEEIDPKNLHATGIKVKWHIGERKRKEESDVMLIEGRFLDATENEKTILQATEKMQGLVRKAVDHLIENCPSLQEMKAGQLWLDQVKEHGLPPRQPIQ